jgi:hypothetical protein
MQAAFFVVYPDFLREAMADSMRRDSSAERGFWAKLWSLDLEEFVRHIIADIVYTVSVLVGLEIFWELIQFLKFRGYPPENLAKLETVHFVFVYLSLLAISIAFICKLVASLWKNR